MQLARKHPVGGKVDWLEVVKACYDVAREVQELEGKCFAGAMVRERVGWFPGLKLLEKYGIVRKVGETVRGGSRAYWIMPDMKGVGRALVELRYLPEADVRRE